MDNTSLNTVFTVGILIGVCIGFVVGFLLNRLTTSSSEKYISHLLCYIEEDKIPDAIQALFKLSSLYSSDEQGTSQGEIPPQSESYSGSDRFIAKRGRP